MKLVKISDFTISYCFFFFCCDFMQALDKGASSLEIGIIIGITSLTLSVFAPIVGYFVSTIIINHSTIFCVLRHILLISAYLLISVYSFVGLNTHYLVHFTYKCIYELRPCTAQISECSHASSEVQYLRVN